MGGMLAIYKREVKAYFQSPSTYVVLALLFMVVGAIFQEVMIEFSNASIEATRTTAFGQLGEAPNATDQLVRQTFQIMVSLLMWCVPVLSMRLLSEEKSSGTYELLVTCPIGDWSILLGKYFALVTVGALIVALSAIYPLMVLWAGRGGVVYLEWPVVISCGLALMFLFASYAAFGVMASSMTENQVTAAIVTLIGLVMWFLLGDFQFSFGMLDRLFEQGIEAWNALGWGRIEAAPRTADILRAMSAQEHTVEFINGVVSLEHVLFYVLSSFLFLFIASKTLDARRWRV